ncbi:MAG TPA: hypothetical protein PKA05_22940, partial [Roseiflexaceae bacterium]|nr:hypothetical protein [Roseiflexaceae bacterium]
PVLFSIIEWNAGAIRGRGADAILVWAVIIAADLVSTFVGLQSTPREALPPLLAWPTANIIGTALVTAFLTFYPEWQGRATGRRVWGVLKPL